MGAEEQFAHIKQLEGALVDLARAAADGTIGAIHIIKAYRCATGSTLKASKDWYDSLKTDPEPTALERLEKRVEALERFRSEMPT